MFTNDDYRNYFGELEDVCKKSLEVYTDLLNQLSDQSMRNKLFMLAAEDMDSFNFIAETKKKYFQ
ncbi:MAG: hypothetical protein PHS37_04955 [Candidatus Omnitrophica bacterium]|nr:hypothetical protein [Candidatus Omnitrophota bacterium]